jgi:hypothetical protein
MVFIVYNKKMLTPDIIQMFSRTVLGTNWSLTPQELNDLIFPSRGYHVIGFYGRGAYGLVLQIESLSDGQIYALKVFNVRGFPTPEAALREFHIQERFARYNMAPWVYMKDIHRAVFRGVDVQFGRVVMDRIACTLDEYIRDTRRVRQATQALLCLVRKKLLLDYPRPYLHSDMHYKNIVVLKDNKTLGFIDFGLAVHKPALLQVLDAIPLVASLKALADSRAYDQKEPILQCAKRAVELFNRFFRVNYTLDGFGAHPSNAYAYRTVEGKLLHSYDWPPTPEKQQTPLPSEEEIREAFPKARVPRITE